MSTRIYRMLSYIASYFPLYILLIISNYNVFWGVDKLKQIAKFENKPISIFILVLVVLVLIAFLFQLLVSKILKITERHKFKTMKRHDDKILNYVVTYIVPMLSINVSNTSTLISNLGLFVLFGFLYVKNSLVHLNPMLLIFGYNIYVDEDDVIVISNRTLYQLNSNAGERVHARRLSENIYLIRK
ncbi:hypothetical protein FCT18_17125 [Lysinibacillus sphaericus]|uniref:Uncharacterized protein n=1 Tax=Lysinibacillus sphaericus TaxID=1421 RepID=A0A2S0JWX5_LYSSH|nr:hypothetical protein [Lysinibacillus sphaericus]AVK95596.1 hypothetical protein LS41612_04560 [Lysinibacillus sphaericus]TKI17651.1 hypothetical protein FCT18_17125 [Lysinibacillus sphaericus]SUV18705.1 Uncharacterised protein [Lysinibacillus sphaericus]